MVCTSKRFRWTTGTVCLRLVYRLDGSVGGWLDAVAGVDQVGEELFSGQGGLGEGGQPSVVVPPVGHVVELAFVRRVFCDQVVGLLRLNQIEDRPRGRVSNPHIKQTGWHMFVDIQAGKTRKALDLIQPQPHLLTVQQVWVTD